MQKGFASLLILVGILVLAAVGGGAYYFGKSQVKEPQPQSSTTVSPPSQLLKTDETANWKTYTNTKYEYSIKYPQQLYLQESALPDDPDDRSTHFVIDPNIQGEVPQVAVKVSDNLSELDAKSWWEQDIKEYGNYQDLLDKTEREEKIVGGYKAYFVKTGSGWISRPFSSFMIVKGQKIYDIYTDFTEGVNYEIYTKMLSTFKFLL